MGYPSRDASLRSIGSPETSQRGRSLDMPGRGTGYIDATEPLNPITEEEEEPRQELEDMSDDDTPQLEDKPSYQRRARVQTDVTVDEPDMEVVPPSRRRSSQEQENDQADVPTSLCRSFSS